MADYNDDITDSPYAWMLQVPEVGDIIRRWQAEGKTEAWLKAQLEKTNWWKTTSSTARQWQQITNEDPAESARQINNAAETLLSTATSMGAGTDWGFIKGLAEDQIRFGLTDQQVRQRLSSQIQYKGKDGQLVNQEDFSLEGLAVKIRAIAADYLIPASDGNIQYFAQNLAAGRITEESIGAYYSKWAKERFPSLAPQIDQGITVKQYMSPLVNQVANLLEIAPEEVDLMDSKWSGLVDYSDPNALGTTRPMTITEASRWARSQTEWQTTANARDRVDQVTTGLLETFGAI